MTEAASASPKSSLSGSFVAGQFIVLPILSAAAAALMAARAYPVDPEWPQDARMCLLIATVVGLLSGIGVAVIFRSSEALRRGDKFGHFRVVAFALVGNHLLWSQPVWAFHHDSLLGVFGWLGIRGEDGFSIGPHLCGLPLTIVTFAAYCGFLHGRFPMGVGSVSESGTE